MRVLIWVFGSLACLGCSADGAFDGQLVNGLSGGALAGARVVAKAVPSSGDMTSRADGSLSFPDLCKDQSYALSIPDPTWSLAGLVVVKGGEEGASGGEIKVWPAPSGVGVYSLIDGKLKEIRTYADVETVKTKGDGTVIRYPSKRPTQKTKLALIGRDDHLVLVGKAAIQNLKVHPLIRDKGARAFQGTTITDHAYIGVKFTQNTQFERVVANIKKAGTQDVITGKTPVRYMSGKALAPGRYALLGDTDDRVFFVDFKGGAKATGKGKGKGKAKAKAKGKRKGKSKRN
jgi:hypothetical protein